MSIVPLWFRERPDFLLPNFFKTIKEHMELEPFRLTSIWYNEDGSEELVYEHKEKKDFFLHITGKGREFSCLMKKYGHEQEMPAIRTYADFLEYMSKC